MAALDRTLALAEIDGVAVPIRGDLDLDVAGLHHQPFDIDPIVAKIGPTLGTSALERRCELGAVVDLPHSLAATTGHRLEQHRQPVLIDKCLEFGKVIERLDHPGDQRNAGVDGELATFGLGTHEPDGGGRWPDPGQPCGLDPFGELGILGEKSIARVNEVRAARLRRLEQAIDIEITL